MPNPETPKKPEATLQQETGGGCQQEPCSRFADTPETNAHLGSHATSPDDTAMWLEIGLPRRFERELNAEREVADTLADAVITLRTILKAHGLGGPEGGSALKKWSDLRTMGAPANQPTTTAQAPACAEPPTLNESQNVAT